jgi:hypothetical protein
MTTTPSHSHLRPAAWEDVELIADVVRFVVPNAHVSTFLSRGESWVNAIGLPMHGGSPLMILPTETAWALTWGVGATETPIAEHLMPDDPTDLKDVVRAALRIVDRLG